LRFCVSHRPYPACPTCSLPAAQGAPWVQVHHCSHWRGGSVGVGGTRHWGRGGGGITGPWWWSLGARCTRKGAVPPSQRAGNQPRARGPGRLRHFHCGRCTKWELLPSALCVGPGGWRLLAAGCWLLAARAVGEGLRAAGWRAQPGLQNIRHMAHVTWDWG
jgi:hypothetical protein